MLVKVDHTFWGMVMDCVYVCVCATVVAHNRSLRKQFTSVCVCVCWPQGSIVLLFVRLVLGWDCSVSL